MKLETNLLVRHKTVMARTLPLLESLVMISNLDAPQNTPRLVG